MTTSDIVSAVRERFVTEVAEAANMQVVHDNGPDPEIEGGQWCRLTVELEMPQQVSTSPARFRVRGRLVAHLHTEMTQGDAGLLDLFATIETAFTSIALADPMVRFYRPGLVGPATTYGGWFRRTARIDFYADEVGTG